MLTDRDYELLSNYLDDALESTQRADLETRLRNETELRRELDGLRNTVTLLNALPPRKAPRNFTLDSSMVRRPAPRRMFLAPVWVSALSAAAAVLLIAFGLLSLTTLPNTALPSASFAAQGGAVAQLPTETSLLKTSDGNLMENADTELPPSPLQYAAPPVEQTQPADVLDQASGMGGDLSPTSVMQMQEAQGQQSLPAEEANGATLSQEVNPAAPFYAPSVTEETGLVEPLAASGAAANLAADSAPQTNTTSGFSASSDQAMLEMTSTAPPQEQAADTAALMATETSTATPTAALTLTSTETSVPPTATPQPTLAALRASPSASDVLPLVSLIAGVLLLFAALVFYLRSRSAR